MSADDWREEWLAAELAAEAELADPPPGAAARVLAGVLATTATTATLASATSATAATSGAATGTSAASALWLKGVVFTGLVAGGVGLSQLPSATVDEAAPVSAPAVSSAPVPVRRAATSEASPTSPTSALVATVRPVDAPPARQPATRAPVEHAVRAEAPPAVQPQRRRAVPVATPRPAKRAPRQVARATASTRARPRPAPPTAKVNPQRPPASVIAASAAPRTEARPLDPTRQAVAPEAPSTVAETRLPISTPKPSAADAPTTHRTVAAAPAAPRSEARLPISIPKAAEPAEAPAVRPGMAGASPDASLRVQYRILTRALVALRAQDPASARAQLRDYRRRFGAGRLDEEFRLMEVRALVAAGERAAARTAAAAFIARYAQSPLRPQIEALVR